METLLTPPLLTVILRVAHLDRFGALSVPCAPSPFAIFAELRAEPVQPAGYARVAPWPLRALFRPKNFRLLSLRLLAAVSLVFGWNFCFESCLELTARWSRRSLF